MNDYTSLKRLAEYHINLHGDTWHAEESEALESLPTFSSEWFVAAASPAAVLALIADIERLETTKSALVKERQAHIAQHDRLQAEVEGLRKERDKLAEDKQGLLEDFGGLL